MKHRNTEKGRTEKKSNHAIVPSDTRLIKARTINPKQANMDNPMGDMEEHNTKNFHIFFLISITIGMILQLMGNNYCVLTGTLLCVSACGLICVWVFSSAVLSHNKSSFLSETLELSE